MRNFSPVFYIDISLLVKLSSHLRIRRAWEGAEPSLLNIPWRSYVVVVLLIRGTLEGLSLIVGTFRDGQCCCCPCLCCCCCCCYYCCCCWSWEHRRRLSLLLCPFQGCHVEADKQGGEWYQQHCKRETLDHLSIFHHWNMALSRFVVHSMAIIYRGRTAKKKSGISNTAKENI